MIHSFIMVVSWRRMHMTVIVNDTDYAFSLLLVCNESPASVVSATLLDNHHVPPDQSFDAYFL